jgi:hypothetical protein
MAQYQPNFADLRVQRRIQRALAFVQGVMSTTKPRAWSTRDIDRWFGQAQTPLSQYLRSQLLITVNDRWNQHTGQCKQYCANPAGQARLSQAIGVTTSTHAVPVVQDEYLTELVSGEFRYQDKSSRLWHPLQNFRRETKQAVLQQAGYGYHYDIEACAMTLIYQHSQQIPELVVNGKWQQGPMDLYLFALRAYLADRTHYRNEIADQVGVDPDVVKRIITALLAGAQLSRSPNTQIYHLLSGDVSRIEFLKQHEFLCELRADIRTCWEYIKPTLPRRARPNRSGRLRMLPVSSRQKWGVYFDLERQVLNEICAFLRETQNKHFLEHDGWSCQREIDREILCERIQKTTGFTIKIDLSAQCNAVIV